MSIRGFVLTPQVHAAVDRREFLCKHPPRCAVCNDPQVQLVDTVKPAEWRCRRCNNPFFYEPMVGENGG